MDYGNLKGRAEHAAHIARGITYVANFAENDSGNTEAISLWLTVISAAARDLERILDEGISNPAPILNAAARDALAVAAREASRLLEEDEPHNHEGGTP